MPTYEYRCPEGHEFEAFQKMSDPPVAECPECGAGAERVISAGAGVIFKGSGFYITDYRSDSYKKAAEADSGKANGKAADGSGGGAAGDAKKTGKTESKAADAKDASGGAGD